MSGVMTWISENKSYGWDDYAMFIHQHWRGQKPLSSPYQYTIGMFISVIGVIAVVGNSIVIWAHIRIKSLRTSSNMLILNLSVGCLIMSLVDLPLYSISSFFRVWIFGNMLCQIYATITGMAGLLIMNSYSAIAIDRFTSLNKCSNPNFPRSKTTIALLSVFVWFYSLSWSLAPVLGWSRYLLDGSRTTCTFDYLSRNWSNRSFILSIALFNFVLPLCFIIFAYTKILRIISLNRRQLKSCSSTIVIRKGKFSSQRRFRGERKTAITLLITVSVFCISWVPYVILAMIGQFGNQELLTPQLSVVPQLVAKMSTVTNPILYSLSHPVVRNKLFLQIRHRMRNPPSNTESSDKIAGTEL